MKRLRYLARPGDWAISMDIADGFHCISIAPEHRCFFTFRLRGQLLRCVVLPFGWSGSPAVFCRCMRVLTRLLRSPTVPSARHLMSPAHWMEARDQLLKRKPLLYTGARTLPYMDDYLLLFPSRSAALEGGQLVRRVLDFLGLQASESKSEWTPTQRLKFLGLDI